MQPMNYNIDVRDPFESALQGFQTGAGIKGLMDKQGEAERQKQAQAQMQAEIATVADNPNATAGDYARIMTLYPKLSEEFKRSWDVRSESQKQAQLTVASQAFTALQMGKNDIAAGILREQAEAKRNSGMEEEAKADEMFAQLIETDPQYAKLAGASIISAMMGPDKFAETFGKLGVERRAEEMQPGQVREQEAKADGAEADATTKGVTAKYAESQALLDMEEKGWNIESIKNDIAYKKESNRIAAINAEIGRQTNALKIKELELKRDDAVRERDAKVRERTGEVESARFNIDNMLSTLDKIIATPMNVVGSAAGPISSRMLTLTQETADFEALVENLDAQAFLSQIPNMKGMGALSDAEGKKVAAALQNFTLKQSPESLVERAREAQRLMLKARKNVADRYGVPDSVPDRPAAQVPGLPPGFEILGKE